MYYVRTGEVTSLYHTDPKCKLLNACSQTKIISPKKHVYKVIDQPRLPPQIKEISYTLLALQEIQSNGLKRQLCKECGK